MKTTATFVFMAIAGLGFTQAILAADAGAGETVFMAHCSGCHNNGLNMIVPEKSLHKDALEKNGKYSEQAIVAQVTQGKSPMPAFGKQLSATEIENVAAFVMMRAKADWK